jgi:5-methylcytosine-specific restriction enzyme subunit McrC
VNVLTLQEYQRSPAVRLTSEQRDALSALVPSLAIVPSRGRSGCYDLKPGATIGAVSLPGLAVEIRPKIEIDRVLFLLSYTLDPRAWRETDFSLEARASLLEAVIPAFAHHVRKALRRGVLQSYRSRDETLAGVRGRIRLDDHLRRRFGRVPPVEVQYDEFTEDVEPNRLILAAADRLERLRPRSESSRAALRWIRGALERVSLRRYHPAQIPEVAYDRLNEHYRGAVELARLLLRGISFDLGHGGVGASAFLIDMNELFEVFVATALREALRVSPQAFPRGMAGRSSGREPGRSLWLDRAQAVRLQPDLSWWDGEECLFVGDVKYKRIRVHGVKHPDLYQLLAYTVAAGVPGGLLIYAAGEGEPVVHEVVDLGKRLEVRTLDLTVRPEEILGQVAELAEGIRELRTVRRAVAV